jgi:hypothetical protein
LLLLLLSLLSIIESGLTWRRFFYTSYDEVTLTLI